ncbi:MAG: CHRD domain-containing protein [Gemmatimonadota bacterium]
MKTHFALFALLALMTVGCDDDDPTGPGNTDPLESDATLTGAAERPDPVTTDATGTATFTVTKGSTTGHDPDASGATTVTYSVSVTGLSGPATMAHIHGPAGVEAAAGIIVPLTVTNTAGTTGVIISGSFTTTGNAAVSMDSLVVLMRNGNSYVNVHTAANPPGEIRGQIVEEA